MKSISYLDMVKEILNEADFFEFEKCYNNPVKKSIKILNHRWYKNKKSDLYNIICSTISDERNLSEPDFSYNWNKYNDVLFATRKENLKPASLWSHFLHQAWLIYVQEMAASLSVQMLWVEPWDYVLDMCAAPWGKSVQIADNLMWGKPPFGKGGAEWNEAEGYNNSLNIPPTPLNKGGNPKDGGIMPLAKGGQKIWFLISNEINQWRKKALEANLHRCGIFNVWIINQDWCVIWDKFPETFDKVLVDAPCSWEGMQYKSDKKIRQRDEKKSKKLSELQIQLLISWLKSLKVWGELVYSTCTTNVLENEYVVSEVLKEYWDKIELLPVPLDEKSDWICSWRGNEILSPENAKKVARLWPHVHWTGGFFIAKFRKRRPPFGKGGAEWNEAEGYNQIPPTPLNKGGNPKDGGIMPLAKGEQKMLYSTRWIQPISDLDFFVSKYTINIAPKSLIQPHFENKIPNIEIWLPIFKILEDKKNNSQKLIPLVWIAQIFGHLATQNVLEINDEQLKLLMKKRDLNDEKLKDFEWNFVILKWNGVWVWLVSVQKWIWKNKCF